jgi:ribose transport system substrate-binding protein
MVALLREQPGIRVPELARLLGVSQATVRTDLNALARAGQVTRVRGGAVPLDGIIPESLDFSARAGANESAKLRIARWAADLVDDGDAILLDASSTVYHMARFLESRRRLTVITNGIAAGKVLAANPGNRVILLGGDLLPDGASVTGLLGAPLLRSLHIRTAFVSCAGFTPDTGLTEDDLEEAQLKSQMIAASGSVVALVDSTKFGRVELAPFARLGQVAHIFTDSDVDPAWIEQLRVACAMLTVCDAGTTATYSPCAPEVTHHRIGFANLSEQIPFAVDVRRGLERAAQEAGIVDLVTVDNRLDGEAAIAAADRLLAQGLDLLIEYQVDARAGDVIMARCRAAGVPAIAVDIPMVGATFFGVDNYRAGHMAGVGLGEWVRDHWDGSADAVVVLEEPRTGIYAEARLRGQLEGLEEIVGPLPGGAIVRLDCGNTAETTEARLIPLLREPALAAARRIAVLSINDDAAIGAIAAARRLSRAEEVIVVGQGADRRAREEMLRPDSRLVGSTSYMPERYGERLIPLALSILRREPVPPAVHVEHHFVTAANLHEFYPAAVAPEPAREAAPQPEGTGRR